MEGDEMICKECRQKISLYLDEQLSKEEKMEFESHINECTDCKDELEKIRNVVKTLNEIPLEELPEGYCKNLHVRLKEVAEKNVPAKKKWSWNGNWKKYTAIAAAVLIVLSAPTMLNLINQTSMKSADVATSNEMYNISQGKAIAPAYDNRDSLVTSEQPAYEESYGTDGKTGNIIPPDLVTTGNSYRDKELKIIKNGYLSIETEEYDVLIAGIKAKVDFYGGYIENFETFTNNYYYFDYVKNEQVNLKNGYMTIRVPQDVFTDAFAFLKESGDVVNERANESDVTKTYYDTENQIKNLEAQETRLRQLMDKAENITEIMQIENELTRVRSQIDAYKVNLSDIDYRSSMSTISIDIREVQSKEKIKPIDNDLWQRAKESFVNSINNVVKLLENFVIFIFGFIPTLIMLIIVGIIILSVVRKIKKNKNKVKEQEKDKE